MSSATQDAIDTLAERFPTLNWTYYDVPGTAGKEKTWHWVGSEDESVVMCVFRGHDIHENFHRQDFFFFNFAYENAFTTISQQRGNRITINPGEIVAGQPYTGYALDVSSEEDTTIVGVLIRREVFYEQIAPLMSRNRNLLQFFIDPNRDPHSDEFIHLTERRGFPYRELLRMMLVEYANGGEGSQDIMQSFVFTLTMYISRQYELEHPLGDNAPLRDVVESYIAAHIKDATLAGTAKALGYHPNYLSALIKSETGKTFRELRTDLRMNRAHLFVEGTTLSIEKIANMLGYSSTINFYRAYRAAYGHSPRAE